MNNFFVNQAKAKNKTKSLLMLYFLAVFAIIIAIYSLLIAISTKDTLQIWQPELFFGTAVAVVVCITAASLIKIAQLGNHGSEIATILGGQIIPPNTTNLKEKRLLNVVEEIAIASGMKVPAVYLLKNEKAINAFAAGHRPGTAVIGVSQGSLDLLSREELQGVIAHEFSHIFNGDMALNLRLIGILNGILFIAIIGRLLMRASSNRGSKKNGAGVVFIGLALFIIGYIGVFFSKLIKMAVSRQREYLADATAVQYTRYPAGIGGALKKIGGLYGLNSKIAHPQAEEASHMFFSNALKSSFSNLLSTHPPLTNRIKAIDSKFNGQFPEINYEQISAAVMPQQFKEGTKAGNNKQRKSALDPLKEPIEKVNPIAKIMATVGTINEHSILAASVALAGIEDSLSKTIKDTYSCRLIIFALLLDQKEVVRTEQLKILQKLLSKNEYDEVLKVINNLLGLDDKKAVMVVDLCLPALNLLSISQYDRFRMIIKKLIHSDLEISLFEYVLEVIIIKHLDHKFYPQKFKGQGKKTIRELLKPAEEFIFGIAILGHQDDLSGAQSAYEAGVRHLGIKAEHQRKMTAADLDPNLAKLDAAISEFVNVDYSVREVMLRAALTTVEHDQTVNFSEYAIMRAISDSLDCPVPFH